MRPSRMADSDPTAESLVEESRARKGRALAMRERTVRWAAAGSFLALAFPFATLSDGSSPLWLVALLVALYGAATRIEFEVGTGSAVPAELVLVPMLFLLPVSWVPLCVAAGLVLGHAPEFLRRRLHPERAAVLVGSAWYSLAPALVLLLAGEPAPGGGAWGIVVAAILAQFALDAASSLAREWAAVGVHPRDLLRPLAWVFMVDALLAPVGLLAAEAVQPSPARALLLAPLLVLIAIFARERETRIGHALELSSAYRGTAFLLGDVIEADDAYTGAHSHEVVNLVLGVCDELGLEPRQRRHAELAALLHDVGKIRIPKEIIHKPGPLDDDEWAIMRTHAAEGQVLLERIGGLLGEVGGIVRSHHERWDGGGYPDGLAGEAIPLVARVITCCDAYNAMTTDRPYRRALPVAIALEELERHAGTQFDPAVVAALARRVGSPVADEPAQLAA